MDNLNMKELVIAKVEGGFIIRLGQKVAVLTSLAAVGKFVKEYFSDEVNGNE